jgi:hypothetical protein
MAGGPTRQDTYAINVHIAGADFGIWDKMTGGEIDSEDTKYAPGGMKPQISLGGRVMTGNITVSRLYRLARDHDLAQWLIVRAGKATVKINKQPLDLDGNVYGRPIVYVGKLKRVTFPEVDSESSTAGLLEIECSTEDIPTS